MRPAGHRRQRLRALAVLLACLLATGCVEIELPRPTPGGGASPGTTTGPGTGGNASGDAYTFLRTHKNGEPVRWSTCEPIRYVVRPDNRPEGADRLLQESIDRISQITGLEFAAEGTTDEAPRRRRPFYQPDRYGDRWAPVLIAYSNAQEDPRLKGQRAGFGGAAQVRTSRHQPRYVTGTAVFDVDQIGSGRDQLRAVMLHELAHVVGLGHVDDPSQLMNPVQYGRGVNTLQQGDINGLEVLGDGECYQPIEPRRMRGGG